MKTRAVLLLALLLTASSWSTPTIKENPSRLSAMDITKRMFSATKTVKTLRYTMKKRERFGDEYREQKVSYKFNKAPLKVYFIQVYPKKGMEVLFLEGHNDNKLLVNPNGFPWVSISLNPMGSKARENQHHTLYESGFDYFTSIMEHLFNKYKGEVKNMVKVKGEVRFEGMNCFHIELNNPYFGYKNYTVKAGEDLNKIARKLHVGEYKILEINDLDDFDDVDEGDIIKVPTDYAPKLEIYIDQKHFVPVFMKVFDEKGMFEQYEYSNLQINPYISTEEFSKDFEGYGF